MNSTANIIIWVVFIILGIIAAYMYLKRQRNKRK